MKRITITLAAALIAASSFAQSDNSMTIMLKNGETAEYQLSEIDQITFSKGIKSTKFSTVIEADFYGDKYGTNAGYFTLALANIEDMETMQFEALNIEGFTELDSEGNITLAPGKYQYEFNEDYTGSPMTFLSYHVTTVSAGTYYTSTLGNNDQEWFHVFGGTIEISKSNNVYVISAMLENEDGQIREFVYEGEIEFTDHTSRISKTIEIGLQEGSAQYMGKYIGTDTDQICITLQGMDMSAADMTINQCVLALYTNSSSEIPEGKYIMAGDRDKIPFTAQRGFFVMSPSPTYVYIISQVSGEQMYFIDQEGEINVSKNGNTYTLDIDFVGTSLTTGELARIKSTYTGALNVK